MATAHSTSPESGHRKESKGKKEKRRESKREEGDEKGSGDGEEPIVFFSPPAGFKSVSRRMKEREKERNSASDDR